MFENIEVGFKIILYLDVCKQGASTTCYVALSPQTEGVSWKCWDFVFPSYVEKSPIRANLLVSLWSSGKSDFFGK
ncbi:hypothetical protein Lalb_Chr07g0182861 [Lupinus albus]|uniref:Uncharacterized protein n=1 Tax=Lupinus albus TaxID=3870 RepID=A0A6A4Q7E7_LUPAL|nr:hypothetical protein Lalb_Chr07g0182861 [Lupinus albus]